MVPSSVVTSAVKVSGATVVLVTTFRSANFDGGGATAVTTGTVVAVITGAVINVDIISKCTMAFVVSLVFGWFVTLKLVEPPWTRLFSPLLFIRLLLLLLFLNIANVIAGMTAVVLQRLVPLVVMVPL